MRIKTEQWRTEQLRKAPVRDEGPAQLPEVFANVGQPSAAKPFPRGPDKQRRHPVPEIREVPRSLMTRGAAVMAMTPADGRLRLLPEETDLHTRRARRMVLDVSALDRVVAGQTARLIAPTPGGEVLTLRIPRGENPLGTEPYPVRAGGGRGGNQRRAARLSRRDPARRAGALWDRPAHRIPDPCRRPPDGARTRCGHHDGGLREARRAGWRLVRRGHRDGDRSRRGSRTAGHHGLDHDRCGGRLRQGGADRGWRRAADRGAHHRLGGPHDDGLRQQPGDADGIDAARHHRGSGLRVSRRCRRARWEATTSSAT